MALSPPLANSLTIAVTVPVPPSTTTEYCLSAASCVIDHGSIRIALPAAMFTVCVKASAPPLKLYQRSVTVVAVTLCSRIGVDQPVVCVGVGQKQSDLVRFGRKNFVAGGAGAAEAIAGGGGPRFSCAAGGPPPASLFCSESSAARQRGAARGDRG